MLDNITCCKLNAKFGEQSRKITKPKKIDTFLHQHFKCTGHLPNNVLCNQWRKYLMIRFFL